MSPAGPSPSEEFERWLEALSGRLERSEIASPQLETAAAEALQALADPAARPALEDAISEVLAQLQALPPTLRLRELLAPGLPEAVLALAGVAIPLDRGLVEAALAHPAAKALVSEVATEAMTSFSRSVDEGARRLGAKLPGGRALGGIVSRAKGLAEVAAQAGASLGGDQRVRALVSKAEAKVMGRAIDWLCAPETGQLLASWRLHMVQLGLETELRTLQEAAAQLDPATLAQALSEAAAAALAAGLEVEAWAGRQASWAPLLRSAAALPGPAPAALRTLGGLGLAELSRDEGGEDGAA